MKLSGPFSGKKTITSSKTGTFKTSSEEEVSQRIVSNLTKYIWS
jgi:hypothetical protein